MNINDNLLREIQTLPKNYFPLKNNKKKYSLKVVAPHKSYLIDLVFDQGLTYLVSIEINTRKGYAVLTNIRISDDIDSLTVYTDKTKTGQQVVQAMQELYKTTDWKPRYLRGDGEEAFDSNVARSFYKSIRCQFSAVKRLELNAVAPWETKTKQTDPQHGSLSLLDRFVRTIRDMAYNMRVSTITPNIMKHIIYNYNVAPHKTLSKIIGRDVSPNEVANDINLENFIVKKLRQINFNTSSSPGFALPVNTSVDVYNVKDSMFKRRSVIKPGSYKVKQREGGLYQVEGANGLSWVPRTHLNTKR